MEHVANKQHVFSLKKSNFGKAYKKELNYNRTIKNGGIKFEMESNINLYRQKYQSRIVIKRNCK